MTTDITEAVPGGTAEAEPNGSGNGIAPVAPGEKRLILVDGSGERTVLLKRDESTSLATSDLQRSWITSARALHLDGFDTAAAITAATWAREAGIPVIGIVIGFVLGKVMEADFYTALQSGRGQYTVFFESPVSLVL